MGTWKACEKLEAEEMRYSSWTHLEPFIAYTRPIVESTSCWDRRKLVIYYFLINHSLNNKLFTPINMMVHYLVIQCVFTISINRKLLVIYINIIIFKIHCLCKWSRNSFLSFRQNVSTILSFIVDDEIRSWSFVEDFEFGEKKEKKIGICNWEKGNREIST